MRVSSIKNEFVRVKQLHLKLAGRRDFLTTLGLFEFDRVTLATIATKIYEDAKGL